MAGNHRSGRKRKPIELHKLHGTYRRDRHAPKPSQFERDCEIDNDPLPALLASRNGSADNDKPPVETDETKPEWYTPENEKAWELWRHIFDSDVGLAIEPSDSMGLTVLSELWVCLCGALDKAMADPCDKAARSAVCSYTAAFDRLASRYGLTPCDREKLRDVLPAPPPAPSKLDRFINGGIPKRKRG